jgi:predicted Zn-dependent protease
VRCRTSRVVAALVVASIALPILAERTKLKPGFNIFSVEQDIEMGRNISKEMEARVEILRDSRATRYIDALGKRLALKAPGGRQYPFQFRIVNDRSVNAAGLPGGLVYVNRGTIEAATGEAQLAGVIAHEIGHVVLRHGTHEVSHAYVLQAPLSTVGATGSTSVSAVLAKIGGGFTASSILLRNPQEAESQADLIGTQIIYDAGYDPTAMARFFEKLHADNQGAGTKPLFSDHPNPTNRMGNVIREIEKLGGVPANVLLDSPEFQTVKLLVSKSPDPRNAPAPSPNRDKNEQ